MLLGITIKMLFFVSNIEKYDVNDAYAAYTFSALFPNVDTTEVVNLSSEFLSEFEALLNDKKYCDISSIKDYRNNPNYKEDLQDYYGK